MLWSLSDIEHTVSTTKEPWKHTADLNTMIVGPLDQFPLQCSNGNNNGVQPIYRPYQVAKINEVVFEMRL